jgi:hypothetical protein
MSQPIVLTLSAVGCVAVLMLVGGYCAVRYIRNSKINLRNAVAAASAAYDPSSASKCVCSEWLRSQAGRREGL